MPGELDSGCDWILPDGESCCVYDRGDYGILKIMCSATNFDGAEMNETVFDTVCPSPVLCNGATASSVSFVTALTAFLVAFKALF